MPKPELSFPTHLIDRFCIVGVNYLHANAVERSLFAITPDKQHSLLSDAKDRGVRSIFALSTCNRSEVYGYCASEQEMINFFLDHTNGTADLFAKHGFIKKGNEALEYLFKMAAGLNSQITGDYEIVNQLKYAVELSRKYDLIGPIMDRTVNFAMQASKSVKTNTNLSNGTVSVSYAVIEWLSKVENTSSKSILLLGAGNLGKNVVKNVQHYLTPRSITVINRTDEIARTIADESGIEFKPFAALAQASDDADIIIVCTNSSCFTILPGFFSQKKFRHIFDLSVPENVHPDVKNIADIKVTGIDEVSITLQDTLIKRKAEVPKANNIIADHLHEFKAWLSLYRHGAALKNMKTQLEAISMSYSPIGSSEQIIGTRINKTVGNLAVNLRERNEKGCQYINAINDFLNEGVLYE